MNMAGYILIHHGIQQRPSYTFS